MESQGQGGRMLMRWQPGVSGEPVIGRLPGESVNTTDHLLEAFHVISNVLFQRSCLDEIMLPLNRNKNKLHEPKTLPRITMLRSLKVETETLVRRPQIHTFVPSLRPVNGAYKTHL